MREQQEYSGYASEKAQDLTELEPVLGIGQGSGLAGSIDSFFSSLAQWSVNPNDNGSRQVVLDRAATLGRSFNQASNGLVKANDQIDSQVRSTVQTVNRLAEEASGDQSAAPSKF